jgi:chromosome segregation ATPase
MCYNSYPCRSTSPRSCCNRCEYGENCLSKEKDILISQLKAHIFELELREKDFNILKERYRNLENEVACLNESKLNLECEKKMKEEKYNNNINGLVGENETLQMKYNEKLSCNKNLYSENNCLGKEIELKEAQICEMNTKLNNLMTSINVNEAERNNLKKIVSGLNDIKCQNNVKLCQLREDNQTLKAIIQDQDKSLNLGDRQKISLMNDLDVKNCQIQNLNNEIQKKICEENKLQNDFSRTTCANLELKEDAKNCECQLNNLKCENDNLKNNLCQERIIDDATHKKNIQLNSILHDREEKVTILSHDLEAINMLRTQAGNKNCLLKDENDKLRKHILVLSDLNQNLNNEIENVICEDQKMRTVLNRKDRINSVLTSNRCRIDKSLNSLDGYINGEKGCYSPKCFNHCCHGLYEC